MSESISFSAAAATLVAQTPKLEERVAELTQDVRLTVLPPTRSGKRIHDAVRVHEMDRETVEGYLPSPEAFEQAEERLVAAGFKLLARSRFAISASAPHDLVSSFADAKLAVQVGDPKDPATLFLGPAESMAVDVQKRAPGLDHLVFIPPPTLFLPAATSPPGPPSQPAGPMPNPPALNYHHLREQDLVRLLNVPPGATGAGVKVAVVDTGFYLQHPYYAQRQVDATHHTPPGSSPAEDDADGHGTAILWNLTTVAPGATILAVKQSSPPQDALVLAADEGARVISCSWGWDNELSFPSLELEIKLLSQQGVVLLFAAGNGHRAWPSSMPEVISVGGVFADPADDLQASSYASGFPSNLYPSRLVPDLCGLCGQKPRGIYLPMPCPPGCEFDVRYDAHGQLFDRGDQTGGSDGWVVASGTSSATPQVAGIVALLLEKADAQGKTLTVDQIRTILSQAATPVSKGENAFRFPATSQVPNVACGHGLANAARALALV